MDGRDAGDAQIPYGVAILMNYSVLFLLLGLIVIAMILLRPACPEGKMIKTYVVSCPFFAASGQTDSLQLNKSDGGIYDFSNCTIRDTAEMCVRAMK